MNEFILNKTSTELNFLSRIDYLKHLKLFQSPHKKYRSGVFISPCFKLLKIPLIALYGYRKNLNKCPGCYEYFKLFSEVLFCCGHLKDAGCLYKFLPYIKIKKICQQF